MSLPPLYPPPSLSLLQPHGPPGFSSHTPGPFLPQGLCTGCTLCLECPSLFSAVKSLSSIPRCEHHFLQGALPDYLSSKSLLLSILHSSISIVVTACESHFSIHLSSPPRGAPSQELAMSQGCKFNQVKDSVPYKFSTGHVWLAGCHIGHCLYRTFSSSRKVLDASTILAPTLPRSRGSRHLSFNDELSAKETPPSHMEFLPEGVPNPAVPAVWGPRGVAHRVVRAFHLRRQVKRESEGERTFRKRSPQALPPARSPWRPRQRCDFTAVFQQYNRGKYIRAKHNSKTQMKTRISIAGFPSASGSNEAPRGLY